MENKIVAGPFLNNLISDYLKIPRAMYSTDIRDAMTLLNRLVGHQDSCSMEISFKKSPNTQNVKITMNSNDRNYEVEGGHIPTTICLLFVNSWSKHLRYYSNVEHLKLERAKVQEIEEKLHEYDYDYELTDEEVEITQRYHPDFHDLFANLNDEQIEALIKYAKQ